MASTVAAGSIVVNRLRDLQAAFEGRADRFRPGVAEVARTIHRHAELLVEMFGDEGKGLRDIRKHVAWYFKGYPVGGELRARMAQVPDLATLRELLAELDLTLGYPARPRGPSTASPG